MQRNFVQDLGKKYLERFSGFNPPKQINLEEISNLLGFIGNQDQNYAAEIANYERSKITLNRQLLVLKKRLNQIQNTNYRPQYSSYRLIIGIEPENAGNFELEISYLINNASWNPLYDLRSNTKGDRLNLTYLAEVKQKTGEDWSNIDLTLSTAKPTQGKLPAKLTPLFISGHDPNFAGRGVGHHIYENTGTSDDGFDFGECFEEEDSSAIIEEVKNIEAEQVVAETTQIGGIVTFNLARKYTIPSDDQSHKVTIFNTDYDCQTQHITVPRIDCFAYLEANTINPQNGVTLLQGQANIFRDNTFIGKTQLENIAPGESFKVNLGIDEGIKITRTLAGREVELIGNYRRITYHYRLEIINLKEMKTKLKVIEQLPVTRDERIKVRLLRTNPEIQLGDLGKLEWLLILEPKSNSLSKQEISYQSSTEYPTNLEIKYSS